MHTSGPQGGAFVALFILFFAFCWIFTGTLVSRMTGWHRLAERFSLEGDFPAERWRFKSATARYGSNYNNCLTIAANPMGFYMATLLPFLTRMSGLVYLAAAVALNARFLYFVVALNKGIRPDLPIRTFRFSITYLMLLFAALIVDHYLYFPA